MEQIDNSREYIYIFQEQFDYLDVLTDSQFARLFRLIRDLRFNGIDTKAKDIDDLMIRGIWISLRPQILTSARNARYHKKKAAAESESATEEESESLPNETEEKVEASKDDVTIKFLLRNFKEYYKETDKFLKKYEGIKNTPQAWNSLIKSWIPNDNGSLLDVPLNKFLKATYKRASENKDKEIGKMLKPHKFDYNSNKSLLQITCPKDCLGFWQRNVTATELQALGKSDNQVEYIC